MSDSIAVQLRVDEGSSTQIRTAVETSHHSVAYVPVVSAAGVVAGPVDEMMTGLSIIEGIDLDAEVKCVGVKAVLGCRRSADVIARTCSGRRWPFCNECAHSDGLGYCSTNDMLEPIKAHLTIVEVLR